MRSDVILIIFGMFIVTYIPRHLPFLISERFAFPSRVKTFLSYVPAAALGALILPDAFHSVEGEPLASALGVITAGILSYTQKNIFITVAGSITITYLTLNFLTG